MLVNRIRKVFCSCSLNTYLLPLVIFSLLLSLTACKTSIRNPSNTDINITTKALPENVLGEVLMEYFGAESDSDTKSIYDNGDKVLFNFSASGALRVTDQLTLVDSSLEIRSSEYIWVDDENQFEYALSLVDGEISKLKIQSIDGDLFYGQFNVITNVANADESNNSNNDQNLSGETNQDGSTVGNTLPESATGQFLMEYTDNGSSTIYSNGDQVVFTFFSTGELKLTEQLVLVDDTFTVRGEEYIWMDLSDGNSVEYALTLTIDDEIEEVNIYKFDGTLQGWFTLISVYSNYEN